MLLGGKVAKTNVKSASSFIVYFLAFTSLIMGIIYALACMADDYRRAGFVADKPAKQKGKPVVSVFRTDEHMSVSMSSLLFYLSNTASHKYCKFQVRPGVVVTVKSSKKIVLFNGMVISTSFMAKQATRQAYFD